MSPSLATFNPVLGYVSSISVMDIYGIPHLNILLFSLENCPSLTEMISLFLFVFLFFSFLLPPSLYICFYFSLRCRNLMQSYYLVHIIKAFLILSFFPSFQFPLCSYPSHLSHHSKSCNMSLDTHVFFNNI